MHVCGKIFIFFNSTQEHAGIAFDTDIINLRVPAGQSEKKQAKRDAFDRELEMNTREEVEKIRAEAKEQMDQALEEQRLKNRSAIEDLKKEYEERHTWYARQILKNITEV